MHKWLRVGADDQFKITPRCFRGDSLSVDTETVTVSGAAGETFVCYRRRGEARSSRTLNSKDDLVEITFSQSVDKLCFRSRHKK